MTPYERGKNGNMAFPTLFPTPMNRRQIRPKGLTQLKFVAILYAYKRDETNISNGIR